MAKEMILFVLLCSMQLSVALEGYTLQEVKIRGNETCDSCEEITCTIQAYESGDTLKRFVKYIASEDQTELDVHWLTVDDVTDFEACANSATATGASMFHFIDNSCHVSFSRYVRRKHSCDAVQSKLVYLDENAEESDLICSDEYAALLNGASYLKSNLTCNIQWLKQCVHGELTNTLVTPHGTYLVGAVEDSIVNAITVVKADIGCDIQWTLECIDGEIKNTLVSPNATYTHGYIYMAKDGPKIKRRYLSCNILWARECFEGQIRNNLVQIDGCNRNYDSSMYGNTTAGIVYSFVKDKNHEYQKDQCAEDQTELCAPKTEEDIDTFLQDLAGLEGNFTDNLIVALKSSGSVSPYIWFSGVTQPTSSEWWLPGYPKYDQAYCGYFAGSGLQSEPCGRSTVSNVCCLIPHDDVNS